MLDGRAVAGDVKRGLADRVARLLEAGAPRPRLALVRFTTGGPEAVYASTLVRAAGEIGLEPLVGIDVPPSAAMEDVVELLQALNQDRSVAGIVLAQPLPAHLDLQDVVSHVDPAKDVDGAHPLNAGRLGVGRGRFVPATALAVMAILRYYEIPMAGRRAVVIGRSPVVGRPVAALLLEADATVTVCHSQTQDLAGETRRAEILVTAAGAPRLVRREMVSAECVVIDAGYNTTPDGIVGDVAFDEVCPAVAAITPVPGGVGRVATVMVLEQTVQAAERAATG